MRGKYAETSNRAPRQFWDHAKLKLTQENQVLAAKLREVERRVQRGLGFQVSAVEMEQQARDEGNKLSELRRELKLQNDRWF